MITIIPTVMSIGTEFINEADHDGHDECCTNDSIPEIQGEGSEEGPGIEPLLARAHQDTHL